MVQNVIIMVELVVDGSSSVGSIASGNYVPIYHN